MGEYHDFIPPCGIFCGLCPNFTRERRKCAGAYQRCRQRRCKTFYQCCLEQHGVQYCHQCPAYPCSRFKQFAKRWLKYGQDMHENQRLLAELGPEKWLEHWNEISCSRDEQESNQQGEKNA